MANFFNFPGFNLTGNDDNDMFRVDIGTVKFGGHEFVLRMMISKKAPPHATHSVASVVRDGKTLWRFDRQRDGGHYTRLALVNDEPAIAYVDQKTSRVVRTHPFSLFDRKLPLPIKAQVEFKQKAAQDLGLPAEYSPAETIFVKVDPEAKRAVETAQRLREEAAAAAAAEAQAKKDARAEQRKRVRLTVAGRERVHVKCADGSIKFGQPVVKREISDLVPNRYYVLVETINQDGIAYEPMKAFKAIAVKGKGIQMEKGGYDVIEFVDTTLITPESVGSDIFFIHEGVFEVSIYENKDDIDTLEKIGVDMIEFVCFPVGNNGQYRVFALDGTEGKTKIVDIGLLKPYRGEEAAVA